MFVWLGARLTWRRCAAHPHLYTTSTSRSCCSKAPMLRCSDASCVEQPSSRPRTSAREGVTEVGEWVQAGPEQHAVRGA